MNPRVCLLTAGLGTRMGEACRSMNKALLPLQNQAILSHLFDRFPSETEWIIGVGFQAQQVKDYIQVVHPELRATFVTVDPYQGPGSGPGYSLLCCESHLQAPFLFVTCDTLWDPPLDLSVNGDWLGVAPVPKEKTPFYCNLRLQNHRVVDLRDKELVEDPDYQAFVGICGIHDVKTFWSALREPSVIQGEHQVSNGLRALINKGTTEARSVVWTDVGDEAKYRAAVLQHENFDFSKTDEALYFRNNRVIKFFADPKISQRRVEKARIHPHAFPTIDRHQNHCYSYPFQEGKTLYQHLTPPLFRHFLEWMNQEVWTPVEVRPEIWQQDCQAFYREKTLSRINRFWEKHSSYPENIPVNEIPLPTVQSLLHQVPWSQLETGIPTFQHGDLQFDNILFCPGTNRFLLLDWRQDFSGHIEYGDLYYDFGKLMGGILLPYDYVKLNLLSYTETPEGIFFEHARRSSAPEYLQILESFIIARGLDLQRVRILVGLIYLNMAPLHHAPFDRLLFSLGKTALHRALAGKSL